ncbi:unnamed protein product [Pylaiella littoralis]
MLRLIIEAFVVGIVMMIMGFPGSIIALKILPVVKDNRIPVMYLSLFLTGVLSHLLFESFLLNSWYCRHGYACLK